MDTPKNSKLWCGGDCVHKDLDSIPDANFAIFCNLPVWDLLGYKHCSLYQSPKDVLSEEEIKVIEGKLKETTPNAADLACLLTALKEMKASRDIWQQRAYMLEEEVIRQTKKKIR